MTKFNIGDTVYSGDYGEGTIKQIDPGNKTFTYYAIFNDGTKIWLSEDRLSADPVPLKKPKKKVKPDPIDDYWL